MEKFLLFGLAFVALWLVLRRLEKRKEAAEEAIIEANTLHLSDDGTAYLEISPQKRLLTYHYRSDDYLFTGSSTEEYRIAGTKVELRLLDDSTSAAGRKPMDLGAVADGVVLEDNVRLDGPGLTSVEKRIEEYRERTQWHEVQTTNVRFWVLAHHPEAVSSTDLRQAIRSEIERLRKGVAQVVQAAAALGIPPPGPDGEVKLPVPAGWSEEQRNEAEQKLDRAAKDGGLTSLSEAFYARKASAELEALLNKVPR